MGTVRSSIGDTTVIINSKVFVRTVVGSVPFSVTREIKLRCVCTVGSLES